jgi:hypothetical protein
VQKKPFPLAAQSEDKLLLPLQDGPRAAKVFSLLAVLYWYKSTNTDTEGGTQFITQESSTAPDKKLQQVPSLLVY